MKKFPIFAAVCLAGGTSLSAETVPSLVVGHYYGVDSYPVHLEDYNRIEPGDTHYTIKSNTPSKPDITLSYSQYPRFWVENVGDEVVTAIEEIYTDPSPLLSYDLATKSLKTLSGETLDVTVYSIDGKKHISGKLSTDHTMSVATLPDGIYIAATYNGKTISALKFVK